MWCPYVVQSWSRYPLKVRENESFELHHVDTPIGLKLDAEIDFWTPRTALQGYLVHKKLLPHLEPP